MRKIILILGIVASCIACSQKDTITEEKPKPCEAKLEAACDCTLEYDPVCGCNNVTYGNACAAGCNNITEFTKGECK